MDFTIYEFIKSDTAIKKNINNIPDNYIIYENITRLIVDDAQPLRNHYGKEVIIFNGYRCPLLNKEVGGVHNSQHLHGQAMDFRVKGETVENVINTIIELGLPYDQLINEYGKWIHLSNVGKNNRKQVFRIGEK